MAVYHILPIFARVTTKTNYMKFRKLRIIQAGVTTNFGVYEGKEFPLVITETAVQSVVTLGNLKPIHCSIFFQFLLSLGISPPITATCQFF